MTMNRPDPPAYVVVLASGGLDSTTLAYHLRDMGAKTRLLSFDYGQRHARELECARQIAGGLGVPHDVMDLRPVGGLLSGSALTDPLVPVPDGHYAAESMRATVVPNRNAVMLDIAVAVAIANGCDAVAFGAHGGDHAIYPDCRPEFVTAFTASAIVANEGFLPTASRCVAPFLDCDKAEIVRIGDAARGAVRGHLVVLQGRAVHCGTCGTCTERREAFQLAGVADPTPYAG